MLQFKRILSTINIVASAMRKTLILFFVLFYIIGVSSVF